MFQNIGYDEYMSKVFYTLASLKTILKKEKPSRVCVVTSRTLKKKLGWALREIPHSNLVLLPDGESAKEWVQIEKLLKQFISIGLDRKSIIIALGGGSVGDTAGFTASLYLRGLAYIQVPTTLLAQVDSAHGGKTGVNFMGYKNQVGSIASPLATIIDTRFLKLLSEEQVIDGLGEIIKAGYINDSSILSILEKEKAKTLSRSTKLLSLVKKSIAVKQFYVQRDPNEYGVRKLLNAGHTIGHAVELKHSLSHGRSVLVGLDREFAFGESLGLTPLSVRTHYTELLQSLGIRLRGNLSVDWKSILHDKKIVGDSIMLPIVEARGESRIFKIKLSALHTYLKESQ